MLLDDAVQNRAARDHLAVRAESLAQAAGLLGSPIAVPGMGFAAGWIAPLALLLAPLLLMEVAQAAARNPEVALRWPLPARAALYAAVFALIVLYGEDGGLPFVYFQF